MINTLPNAVPHSVLMSQDRGTFLTLPREIRDITYGFVLDDFAEAVANDSGGSKHVNGYWSRPLHIEHTNEEEAWPAIAPQFYVRQHLPPCPHEGLFDVHPVVTAELCEELQDRSLRTTISLSLRRQTKRPRQLMGNWTSLDLPLYVKHTVSTLHFQIPSTTDAGFSELVPILRPFLDDTAPSLFAHLPHLDTIDISFPSIWDPPTWGDNRPILCVEIRSLDYPHYACGDHPTFRVTEQRSHEWKALNVPIECPATDLVAMLNYMRGDHVELIPWIIRAPSLR